MDDRGQMVDGAPRTILPGLHARRHRPWSVLRRRWGERPRELGPLVVILLLAAILRMGWPGLTEFKADEARLLALSLDLAELQYFPVRGIASSIGFPNAPVSVWLYALPLFLWRHVYAATLFTGLANVLAVLGCWWLTRRYWGSRAALAAALLFATAPWAIIHGRKIWAQNLLPPLAVAWAITAALSFVERKPRALILHLVTLALAAQVHFAGVALLPATLLFLLVFRKRVRWQDLLVGSSLALFTALPFLYALFGQDGNWWAALRQTPSEPTGFSLSAWRYLLLLSNGGQIHSLAGPERFGHYLQRLPPMTPVHIFWSVLVLGGALWLLWRLRPGNEKRSQDEAGFLILVWLLAAPLTFTWFPVPVALHYLLPAYPAPYVAAGALFAAGVRRARRWRLPAWLLLGASAGLQVWAWVALLGFVSTQHTPDGFGTPLAMKLEAVSLARRLQRERGAGEVLLASSGEEPALEQFPAVYDVLLRHTPHRFVDVTRSALFPGADSIVILDAAVGGPGAQAYQHAAHQTTSVPLRHGEGSLQILYLPNEAAPAPQVTPEEPHLFSNYVKIYGYDLAAPEPGRPLSWHIYWHPADNPTPIDYHFFNHLLDSQGQRVAQEDAAAFAPRQWQAGDSVVSYFLLSPPQEASPPFTMRTGIYRYPGLENVPLMDVAGNPLGDALQIPLGDLGVRLLGCCE